MPLRGLTRTCGSSSFSETAEAWGVETPRADDSLKTSGGGEKNKARGRHSRRRMRVSKTEGGQHLIHPCSVYWSLI